MEGDFSALSKKVIVLNMASLRDSYSSTVNITNTELSIGSGGSNQHTDPKAINYVIGNKYLEFAKKGGTIVVTNIVKPDINYISNQNVLQYTE
jgi:hypothetical protein